jgi:hypothetical protein
MKFASILLEAVSGWSATAMTSFKPTGMPSKGPRDLPVARRTSDSAACFNASASSRELNAWIRSSTARVRASTARVSSTEDKRPAASCADNPAMV